jgi:hypothetical protein
MNDKKIPHLPPWSITGEEAEALFRAIQNSAATLAVSRYKAEMRMLGASVEGPTAEELEIKITAEQVQAFIGWINRSERVPRRLRQRIWPVLDMKNFAQFFLLAGHPAMERAFLALRGIRGKVVATSLRKLARQAKADGDDQACEAFAARLASARLAHDTRRKGLAGVYGYAVVDSYVEYRTGLKLQAAEWQALLSAADEALGRSMGTGGDGVTLVDNLRKFRKMVTLTGENATKVIEKLFPRT